MSLPEGDVLKTTENQQVFTFLQSWGARQFHQVSQKISNHSSNLQERPKLFARIVAKTMGVLEPSNKFCIPKSWFVLCNVWNLL
jgi:predicted  nucleic acid-binding Zn ribbon protein